jgi:hypothetical protein
MVTAAAINSLYRKSGFYVPSIWLWSRWVGRALLFLSVPWWDQIPGSLLLSESGVGEEAYAGRYVFNQAFVSVWELTEPFAGRIISLAQYFCLTLCSAFGEIV